ncbi:MAG TPA: hypothetical protein VG013_21310 [Gemmataceae bacterium]|jgi:hypothetical protein|nr:hypothetical protein [Gemmataceae bacterium]
MSKGIGTGKSRGLGGALCRMGSIVPALLGSLLFTGCTRHFFRNRADMEVNTVLAEKDQYPDWRIEQYHVYPDPRARYADPTNPDRPPTPPDDPAAYKLSPHPQHVTKGFTSLTEGTGYLGLLARWDAENRAAAAREKVAKQRYEESRPTLAEALGPQATPGTAGGRPGEARPGAVSGPPGTLKHPYLISMEQAVELGVLDSREHQDRREDLYMTALPVTLERFAFAAQWFAAEQAIREWAGRDTPQGKSNAWRLSTNVGFGKLFSTGGLLLANIANQTVFQMAQPFKGTTSVSQLNFDFVQPLLRGGGRAVTLEPLTQAERNLLYEIRQFARFRKEFFVSIAGGGGGSITGGAFQPTGVLAGPGFSPTAGIGGSGLVAGVIPGLPLNGASLSVTPVGSGSLNLGAELASPVGGYLGTSLQYAQIALDDSNIANLEYFLRRFEGLKEGGDYSQLQVDQIEQQLLRGRTTLLTDEQQYVDSLDRLRLQLGLAPNLPVELDTKALKLINEQFNRYQDIQQEYRGAIDTVDHLDSPDFVPKLRAELLRLFTSSPIVQDTRFRVEIPGRWSAFEKLSDADLRKRLTREREERIRLLALQTDLEVQGKQLMKPDADRLKEINFDVDLGEFELALREYRKEPWKKVVDPRVARRQQIIFFRGVVEGFALVVGEARSERLDKLRDMWPELPKLSAMGVDFLKVSQEQAEAVASQQAIINRLDLMNVRAQLVDAWRQVAVFANALLGTFNVEYHFESFTPAGQAKPLDFGGSRNSHQLLLNAQPPLVRKPQRNNYRAALIAYQRERRTAMEAEDLAMQTVRGEIRQLRVFAENYKIMQRQVELGFRVVESALENVEAPPAPVPPAPAGAPAAMTTAAQAANAAALTNQLLTAQTNLYNAEYQLITLWINYLNSRMQLYRDMELMPLDNRGVWIDESTTTERAPGTSDRPADGGDGDSARHPGTGDDQRLQVLPEIGPLAPGQSGALEQAH